MLQNRQERHCESPVVVTVPILSRNLRSDRTARYPPQGDRREDCRPGWNPPRFFIRRRPSQVLQCFPTNNRRSPCPSTGPR